MKIDLTLETTPNVSLQDIYDMELEHFGYVASMPSDECLNEQVISAIYELDEDDKVFVILLNYFNLNVSLFSRITKINRKVINKEFKRIREEILDKL